MWASTRIPLGIFRVGREPRLQLRARILVVVVISRGGHVPSGQRSGNAPGELEAYEAPAASVVQQDGRRAVVGEHQVQVVVVVEIAQHQRAPTSLGGAVHTREGRALGETDGLVDLFLGGDESAPSLLLRNVGGGDFQHDARAAALLDEHDGLAVSDALFADYDNDGRLDLLSVGGGDVAGGTLRVFRNAGGGGFEDVTPILPATQGAARVAAADFGNDGDLDLVLAMMDGSARLLRNDGGDANHYLSVRLVGLSAGSGKNNHFGVGAKLELRAGADHQVRFVTGPTTVFGLGGHGRADVVRVRWTNGVPQNLFFPDADQSLVEEQVLKGSCPFLYTWNGERFVFVADFMWRSALGMPVGIMGRGADRAYAPASPSEEYVKIPGEALRPKDGEYVLQVTEELWEIAYLDELKLLVVDHPASVDVFVDERFVPPAPVALRLYQVEKRGRPVAALDHLGRDALPALAEADFDYVADFRPGPYQGITELHDLVLDLGEVRPGEAIKLFLRGWVHPTDASINVAMSQSDAVGVVPLHLQVAEPGGGWRTVIDDLGVPSGKNKIMVTDLTGLLPEFDRRVRIRTNLEVYWDEAFVPVGEPSASLVTTTLSARSADLHERGFSRLYRRGGRFGPHWFDYEDVVGESPWRPLAGPFTRYGDVAPLLEEGDDRFVVLAPGDEATIRFDADAAPPLSPGWRRDFLLYSEGWVKDADLNTAYGAGSHPLPFRAMSGYPYGADESYPTGEKHREYLERYHTRSGKLEGRFNPRPTSGHSPPRP